MTGKTGTDPRASDLRSAARRLHAACAARGMRFGTAESCTGGLVAAIITEQPGVSDSFAGAIVCYANDVKRRILGVRAATLERNGAVSAETALDMALGARRALRCDAALALTGIAGPGGAVPGKPVGTVWCATSAGSAPPRAFLVPPPPPGATRRQIRRAAALAALQALADAVEGIPATRPPSVP